MEYYIETYGRRLFGLCMHLCRSRAEAEDLYQDLWLRLLERWHLYRPEESFEGWAVQICVNLYRDRLRRLRRALPTLSFQSWEEQDAHLASLAQPEAQDYSDLHEAITRLPQRLRLPIVLYYFNDQDIRRTAQLMGLPEGTVKSRLSKARSELRRWLTDETEF